MCLCLWMSVCLFMYVSVSLSVCVYVRLCAESHERPNARIDAQVEKGRMMAARASAVETSLIDTPGIVNEYVRVRRPV